MIKKFDTVRHKYFNWVGTVIKEPIYKSGEGYYTIMWEAVGISIITTCTGIRFVKWFVHENVVEKYT